MRAPLSDVWRATQDPTQHQRWDVRFTEIRYAAAPTDGEPQAFHYALRVGPRRWPLLRVAGTGRTLGERTRPDGTCTSALGFSSTDRRSLIRAGAGWWRYVPDGGDVRFLTGYDYSPGWGRTGKVVDRLAFRPWLGWATAWSFDRLRLWLDNGVTPETALRRWLTDTAMRAALVLAGAVVGWRIGHSLAVVVAAVVTVAIAAVLPPLPGVPRARRCRRHPLDGAAPWAQAPDTLAAVTPQAGR